MKKQLPGFFLTVVCHLLLMSSTTFAINYYVDPSSTSSTANGTLANPWKTIAQVNSGTAVLNPGDMVLFKRGQSFSGQLIVSSSGTAINPIVYSNYGTGNLPVFNNAVSDIISITSKQYVVIDGIQIIDSSLITDTAHAVTSHTWYAILLHNAPNCTVKNCDISLVGNAINVYPGSDYTTITGNYIHNLRMVINTPTSINSNDDNGAIAVGIESSYNAISYNRFEECWAISYDYGYDGGAIEMFGSTVNNNNIMYNTAINCNGFMEIGSSTNGVANNNMIAYNKVIDCGCIGTFQNSGAYAVNINNLQYYNNTVVETIKQNNTWSANMFWMAGTTGTAGMVVVKNNIFWLSTGVNLAQSKFDGGPMVHSNNIYRMSRGSLGITLNSRELFSTSVNLFTSTKGNPSTWNYNLLPGSKAIHFGTNAGFTKDFAGNPIVGNPDAGILEYIPSNTTPKILH